MPGLIFGSPHPLSFVKDLEQLELPVRQQTLSVLATHRQGQPHASLIAFAATADGRELIFATTRTSRKFANLQADARATLLIDSRTNQEADFHLGQALSAAGTVIELSGPEKPSRLQLFLTKHPHLREFVQSPSCALMSLHVQVYNLVSKFQSYRVSAIAMTYFGPCQTLRRQTVPRLAAKGMPWPVWPGKAFGSGHGLSDHRRV